MRYTDGDTVQVELSKWFRLDPTVGVLVLDRKLRIEFANRRWAELFEPGGDRISEGASLWDLFPQQWVEERQRIVERVITEERPIVIRHIRRGQRVQSTCYPLYAEEERPGWVLVFAVVGESDLREADGGLEVVEAGVVDLGPLDRLTRRELEVLALVGHGMGREQIARKLFRSPKTVDNHMAAISAKLGAANRAELVKIASTAGLRVEHADLPRTQD